VQALLAGQPLVLQLAGLDHMSDDPTDMHVLYLKVRALLRGVSGGVKRHVHVPVLDPADLCAACFYLRIGMDRSFKKCDMHVLCGLHCCGVVKHGYATQLTMRMFGLKMSFIKGSACCASSLGRHSLHLPVAAGDFAATS
jgi:hypothetical protein